MKPVTSFAHTLYHRYVPYDVRIKLWSARRKRLFDFDRLPPRGAMPAERYAVRLLGAKAVRRSAFAQAIIARSASDGPEHTMMKTWVDYALGTNERGETAVRTVQPYIAAPGARQLDIGCAYGGTPIAFARAGADAYGVEIDPGLLELARLNLADHPGVRCTLLNGDILQPAIADGLGRFDIITCDNVIEHVERARELVSAIAQLLKPAGACVMGIPNAFALSQVMRDGHYGLFGLTLLERDRAIAYYTAAGNGDPYGVAEYCFTYADYSTIFGDAGLSIELLNPIRYARMDVDTLARQITKLRRVFQRQVAERKIPTVMQAEVHTALERYLARFAAAYADYQAASDSVQAEALGSRLLNEYQQAQWLTLVRHR